MIAGTLGVEVKTVESAYAKELASGQDQVKLETMKELFRAAKGNGAGKVSAAVKLLDLLAEDDKADAGGAVRPNGKTRVVGFWGHHNVCNPKDGTAINLYDNEGTLCIVFHPDDENL